MHCLFAVLLLLCCRPCWQGLPTLVAGVHHHFPADPVRVGVREHLRLVLHLPGKPEVQPQLAVLDIRQLKVLGRCVGCQLLAVRQCQLLVLVWPVLCRQLPVRQLAFACHAPERVFFFPSRVMSVLCGCSRCWVLDTRSKKSKKKKDAKKTE